MILFSALVGATVGLVTWVVTGQWQISVVAAAAGTLVAIFVYILVGR